MRYSIRFGWRYPTTKVYGPTFEHACGACHQVQYWYLTRVLSWLTLYYIPILPYQREYFVKCPACQFGFQATPEDAALLKKLARANQLLFDEEITQAEYHRQLSGLQGLSKEAIWSTYASQMQRQLRLCKRKTAAEWPGQGGR